MVCRCPEADLHNNGIEWREGQAPGDTEENALGYGPSRTGWSFISGTTEEEGLELSTTYEHYTNIEFCPFCGGSLKDRPRQHVESASRKRKQRPGG